MVIPLNIVGDCTLMDINSNKGLLWVVNDNLCRQLFPIGRKMSCVNMALRNLNLVQTAIALYVC